MRKRMASRHISKFGFWLIIQCFSLCLCAQQNVFQPVDLKCYYWINPYGIDQAQPQLSWTIQPTAGQIDLKQSAYQVLVASAYKQLKTNRGDTWNSGRVKSAQMFQITYGGRPLLSGHQYWWKVRLWDENGHISSWSRPNEWTMGILARGDWQAKWISAKGVDKYAPKLLPVKTDFVTYWRLKIKWQEKMPKPKDPNFSSMLLRKDFTTAEKPIRCIINVCGLGEYELRINGKKVSNDLFGSGWSEYDKTVLYNTYDVTSVLHQGTNTIGVVLSNGVYNIQPDSVRYVKMLNSYGPLKVIAQLRMEYADGSVKIIGTDNSWKVHTGPVTYMNYYGGEDYDARLEPTGWSSPFFSQGKYWQNAIITTDTAKLEGLSCSAPTVKAIQKLKYISLKYISKNVCVYDLGQNASMMPEIQVSGKSGSFVRIIPAELLNPDGTVDRRSVTQDGVRPSWWQYTLNGKNHSNWFPRFFYHGCRYLQVELFPAPCDNKIPVLEKISGVVVHGSAAPVGKFSCSNELFNKIYNLVRWAQRSNMMTILTDCPHRERMPWLEEYHLNGPALRYNFDLTTLFGKAVNDMADAQLENGLVPNIAPEYFHAGEDWKNNGFRNSPEWGSAFIIVPWQQYLFSGDLSLIDRFYSQMKHYMAFLDSESKDHLLTNGLGDWYDIGPKPAWGSQLTPESFTATAIYQYDCVLMAKMAALLKDAPDAEHFEKQAQAIKEAFNRKFYNAAIGTYATGSNTTCAMPLFFNLVAPENRDRLFKILVDSIRSRNNSFTSGEIGYRFLLKTLTDNGYSDVIYDMNNQTEHPGYGYQIKHGGTSLSEKWDGGVGNFGSQNHFMSGQINEWFFSGLLGIGPDETAAGFKNIIIKPAFVKGLKWVSGSYQSVSGLIAVSWKRNKGKLAFDISIPANSTANLYIPSPFLKRLTKNGKKIKAAIVPALTNQGKNTAILKLGSGKFHFVTQEPI